MVSVANRIWPNIGENFLKISVSKNYFGWSMYQSLYITGSVIKGVGRKISRRRPIESQQDREKPFPI